MSLIVPGLGRTVNNLPIKLTPTDDDRVYTGGSPNFDENTGRYRDNVYTGGSPDFDENTGRYRDNVYTGGNPKFDENTGRYRNEKPVNKKPVATNKKPSLQDYNKVLQALKASRLNLKQRR